MIVDKSYSEWLKENTKEPVEVIPYPCIEAFSSPIWIFDLTQPKELNEKLTNFAYLQKKLDQEKPPVKSKSNRGGWHSQTNMQEYKECWEMISLIETFVRKSIEESRIKKYGKIPTFGIGVSIWFNINSPGDSNGIHTHPNSHYSGCYYIKVPEGDAGILEIYNPKCISQNLVLPDNDKYSTTRQKIKPKEGRFVLFKSDTHHEVRANNTDEDRISLAFNVVLKNLSEEDRYEP